MAANILGRGMDRHVDPMLERAEEVRGAPGVVHQHLGAVPVGDCRDRRNVLHLEGQRARRLAIDDFGVGLDQLADALADQRIVIGRLDSAFLQNTLAEIARRPIGRVDHQAMVAGAQQGLQWRRHRRQPRRHQHAAIAAFDPRQERFEREGSRRAVQPIAHPGKGWGGALGFPLGHVFREDRRGVIDWRVDDAVIGLGVAPDMGEQRILAIIARPIVVFHVRVAFC